MLRTRQLRVNALNFAFVDPVLHDKPEKYRELMLALYKLQKPIPLHGNRAMTIGSLGKDEYDLAIQRGVLYSFVNLDRLAWFNLLQNRPATDVERNRIIVPKNIAANYRSFDYEFHSDAHMFVFVAQEGSAHVSASQVRYVFEQLCSDPGIVATFGDINVSVAQEPEALDQILDAHNLRALSILVRRPNAGLSGFEEEFAKGLERIGASQGEVAYKAATGESLKPDKGIRTAAKAALSDGVVEATIKQDGITKRVSTERFPVSETVKYDPKKESRPLAIRRAANAIIERVEKSKR